MHRMTCFTRNFEDVILQRVFYDIPKGHYLDVGAWMPIEDSNTFGLYLKGWRGVAIEPQGGAQTWKQARPEDVLLRALAGGEKGQRTMQVFQTSQISSGDPNTVEHLKANGYATAGSAQLPVVTLDDVIDEHLAGKPLHLLSIDVEGMEPEVLKGLDLKRHRPWVMIVEAVLSGSQTPMHAAWEPAVLEAGYHMAYFDGVNRFYLAHEQRHLLGHFALPPNVWDGFVMMRQVGLQMRVTELEAEVERLRKAAGAGEA